MLKEISCCNFLNSFKYQDAMFVGVKMLWELQFSDRVAEADENACSLLDDVLQA